MLSERDHGRRWATGSSLFLLHTFEDAEAVHDKEKITMSVGTANNKTQR
jgi:hypothetical protein